MVGVAVIDLATHVTFPASKTEMIYAGIPDNLVTFQASNSTQLVEISGWK